MIWTSIEVRAFDRRMAEAGLTQKEVSDMLGIPKQTFLNYSAGRRRVPGWLPKLAWYIENCGPVRI